MSVLADKHCEPCKDDALPLAGELLDRHLEDLGGNWLLINDHHIEKEFPFKNFQEGLIFTNKVAEICESEGHHPDIHLTWGKVRILLWTHKINGLSSNDFILASKIDLIYNQEN